MSKEVESDPAIPKMGICSPTTAKTKNKSLFIFIFFSY
jgi:hypothetical protein